MEPMTQDPIADKQNARKQGGLSVGYRMSGRGLMPQVAINWKLLQYPIGMDRHENFLIGKPRDTAANDIATAARDLGCSHVAFFDDDVEPPIDVLPRLVNQLKQREPEGFRVIGGIYTTKSKHPEPLVFRGSGNGVFWHWKAGEVFWVDGIALGCMVASVGVLDHLTFPYFKDVGVPETAHKRGAEFSDDLYFCHKVRAAGFRILADGAVLCRHWDPLTGTSYQLAPDSYPMLGRGPEELQQENGKLRDFVKRMAAPELPSWIRQQAQPLVDPPGAAGTGGVDQPIPLREGQVAR